MAHRRIDYAAGSTNPIYFGGEWQPSPTDKREQTILSAVIDNPDFLKMSDAAWDTWLRHTTTDNCITPVVGGAGIGSALPRRGRPRKDASNEMD